MDEVMKQCEFDKLINGLAIKDCFGPSFAPEKMTIQVVIEVPAVDVEIFRPPYAPKLTTFKLILKKCSKSVDLPLDGDFLELFEWTDEDCGKVKNIEAIGAIVGFTGSQFFVRKESLCVLKNFIYVYQNELKNRAYCRQQFIVMGTPGTGKSCILALLCFFIAVKYKRPVVWRREGVNGDRETATRLLYEGKCYEWDDLKGEIYEHLHNALYDQANCAWFCLDGLSQNEIEKKN